MNAITAGKTLAFLCALGVAGTADAAERYRVVREKGVYWFQAPSGEKILSLGVNEVAPGVSLDEYRASSPAYCAVRFNSSLGDWRKKTVGRLKKWGFNTLGAGSEDEITSTGGMPYIVNLNLGKAAGAPWSDPDSIEARARYREILTPLARIRNDPNLIGYFLDGQLGWWDETVFLQILKQPTAKDPLKQPLIDILRKHYRGKVASLDEDIALEPALKEWDDLKGKFRSAAFRTGRRPLAVDLYLEWLAKRYYRATTEELRRADGDRLIFGDRYGGYYSQAVARAAAKYVDVISTNYDTFSVQGWVCPSYIESLARITRKPILVSECYFAAADNGSGNRNRNGSFMTVETQKGRAAGARNLATSFVRFKAVVGYHWYRFADQPPGSSARPAQGEDFNVGLVDLRDREYRDLTGALANANENAAADHGTSPAGMGLQRTPLGLSVPALGDLPVIDGLLDEWALEKAWMPETGSAAPFEPFGDIYVSWHPEGLAVAVVYRDYRARARAKGGVKADTERLTIGFGLDDEKPIVFTLQGVQERENPGEASSAFKEPEVAAVRGGVRFPAAGRFLAAQGEDGVTRIVEVFLPAALFRRERLATGNMMRGVVSLRLRANFKELFWPRPFKLTGFSDSSDWGSLTLGAAGDEKRPTPPRRASVSGGSRAG